MKLRLSRSELKAWVSNQIKKGYHLESETSQGRALVITLLDKKTRITLKHSSNSWLEVKVEPIH